MSFHLWQSFSVSFFHVSLGLPAHACHQSVYVSHAVLTAPLEYSTCPFNQRYALILTRSGLVSLCVDLHTFLKEFWPLTDVRISFPLNIIRMNGWNMTKIGICIDEMLVGIVICKIAQIKSYEKIYNRVMGL